MARIDWRKALVVTHRWLGIVFGLLFVAWFASGIVMVYARMPELPASERQAWLRPIDLSRATIGFDAVANQRIERARVAMLMGRPVYRLLEGRRWSTIFADTGEPLAPLTEDAALAVARELQPDRASSSRVDALLADADQWTMGVRAQMPMYRIALDDRGDTYLYVTARTGEAVMRTTARERRWAYAGAVIHWLYFAPFRRQAALWTQSIIWLSIAGCVLCLAGLVWGISVARRSPYSGLLQWHHYAGLIFGVTTLTWVFSGLLSMDPWAWSPSTAATSSQRERVAGGALEIRSITLPQLRAAALALGDVKEIEIGVFQGERYAFGGSKIVSVDRPERGIFETFPIEAMDLASRAAMPDVPIVDAALIDRYDDYYYSRDGELSLPVLRVRYGDANATWLYFDPRRGAIVRKEERLSRVNRWLYHGLHSLDFPFLHQRRPLWDAVVVALSLGGIVLSTTTLLPGWRRLRKHVRRLSGRSLP